MRRYRLCFTLVAVVWSPAAAQLCCAGDEPAFPAEQAVQAALKLELADVDGKPRQLEPLLEVAAGVATLSYGTSDGKQAQNPLPLGR